MNSNRWFVAALVLLASCASVRERADADRRSVAADVQLRTGESATPEDLAAARALLDQPIDIDGAVRIALALDPGIRERFAELGVASAERIQAGRIRNPMLQASAAFFDGDTQIELGVTQWLLDLITRSARNDAAQARLDAARAEATRGLVHSIYEVRRAWVDAFLAQREVEMLEEVNAAEQAADELSEALHAAGNLTDPKRTASETSVARSRLDLIEAQERLSSARERLAMRLGLPDGLGERRLIGELDTTALGNLDALTPDGEAFERRAVEASLELLESRSQVAGRARAAGVAGWNSLLANASIGVVARRENGEDALGPSVTLPLPVFDVGSGAKYEAAQALEAALARHDARVIEIRSAARRLRARWVLASQRARTANDELLPLSRRLVTEVLREFNAMQIGVFDVLEARRVEFSASRAALESLRDAWSARIDLEELLAGSRPPETNDHADSTAGL